MTINIPLTFKTFKDNTVDPVTYNTNLASISAALNALIPVGTIHAYGGATAPGGYLICNGTSYLRTDFPELFAAIGTAFGTADATHFNVPDLRGRFLRGKDGEAGLDPDRATRTAMATGGATGDNVGSVQEDTFQGHRHNSQWWNGAAGSNYMADIGASRGAQTLPGYILEPITDTANGTPRTSSETRPINANVNFIIRY